MGTSEGSSSVTQVPKTFSGSGKRIRWTWEGVKRWIVVSGEWLEIRDCEREVACVRWCCRGAAAGAPRSTVSRAWGISRARQECLAKLRHSKQMREKLPDGLRVAKVLHRAQHAVPLRRKSVAHGKLAWRDAGHQVRSPAGTASVECGGLPPLYSGEACLARSETYPHPKTAPRQPSGSSIGAMLQDVPASRDGKQRRQAAALQILRGDANARMMGSRIVKHLRP